MYSVMYKIFVIFLICTIKSALCLKIQNLPCLTHESKKDLDDAREELGTVDSIIGKTVGTLENDVQKTVNIMKKHLVTMKSTIGKIIKKVETDLIVLKKDLKSKFKINAFLITLIKTTTLIKVRIIVDFNLYS